MKESRGNYIILREDGIVARLFNNTVEVSFIKKFVNCQFIFLN